MVDTTKRREAAGAASVPDGPGGFFYLGTWFYSSRSESAGPEDHLPSMLRVIPVSLRIKGAAAPPPNAYKQIRTAAVMHADQKCEPKFHPSSYVAVFIRIAGSEAVRCSLSSMLVVKPVSLGSTTHRKAPSFYVPTYIQNLRL